MIRNVGNVDKIIRLVVGIALIAFGIFGMGASALGLVAAAVGAILVGTGVINFCPLFKMFGISSHRSTQ